MPCAEGDLCLQQDKTSQDPHGHVWQGGCGGRLHGNCGSVFDDIETYRICSIFLTKAKMAMIAEHSAKLVRQSDMREFVAATEQG